jgi:thiol-disulfide isomerase/thioredoxin
MKKTLSILLIVASVLSFAMFATPANIDNSEVEPKYLTADSFNQAINTGVVIVEFVASFVEPFDSWQEIKDGEYYRVDIEKYPELRKKYKVRSVPTIVVFNNGMKELVYKANIMLELDVTADEIHEDIEDLLSDKF